jgi:HK97 family phage major capsid protein
VIGNQKRDMTVIGVQKRDLTVSGGDRYTVGTEIGGFADALAKASIVGRLPMVRHTGLKGDQVVTLKNTAHAHTWLAADGSSQISDAQATYGQLALAPKSVAATLTLSRQFMTQMGPLAAQFVDAGLARALAEALDGALLGGSGASGQPSGVFVRPNIDSRAGTSFALSDGAAMLKVCDGYASDAISWVCGVDVAEDLRQRQKHANGGEMLMADDGRMLGYPVLTSRSAGAQQLVVTDWSKCHFAEWGALEVGVDPFTNFKDGRVIVRALWRVDFGFERNQQIAVCTALT